MNSASDVVYMLLISHYHHHIETYLHLVHFYLPWPSLYYNHGHNILRLFDIWPNFSFTTSETNCDS